MSGKPPAGAPMSTLPTSRNLEQWMRRPNLPDTHYIDTRVYTEPSIFAEEIDRIFHRLWLPVCHESELPEAYDFRTAGVAGRKPIVMVRGADNRIRTFLNVCPHRGNTIV